MSAVPGSIKTPGEIADEAAQAAQDAARAARGHALEAAEVARTAVRSVQPILDDARSTIGEAMGTVQGLARDVRDIARDAVVTGGALTQRALDAAGRRLDDGRARVLQTREQCEQYIAAEPVKATLWAMAGGALLAMLLGRAMRPQRRRRTRS